MIAGRHCWRQGAQIKRDAGYVPGDLRLYPWLTTLSALRLFGRIRGRDMLRHGRELAEDLGLELNVAVRRMSRGTRQKLGLVLALAHRPRILILDEPTSSLDPIIQDRLRARLRALAADGCTIFFSSHTLGEVDDLCDRVGIIRDGKLVAEGTLESLRARAGHEVTIRWTRAQAPESVPPFLALDRREPAIWEGTIAGPVRPLLDWLAGRAVEDLTITRPDLETLFRRYYDGER